MSPVAKAPRRYFIEFNGAMLLYVAAVLGRGELAGHMADPVLKALILISPILPVLLATLAVLRFYRGMDEYHRTQLLESFASAAALGSVLAISWSFLEDIGLPHLSLAFAWPFIGAAWGVIALWRGFRDKIADGNGFAALRMAAVTLIYVAAGTAVYAALAIWIGLSMHWAVLALVATGLFTTRMGFFIFSKNRSC